MAAARLLLNSVLNLWRISAERCFKLEEELARLKRSQKTGEFL
jgi:hypothetical protein